MCVRAPGAEVGASDKRRDNSPLNAWARRAVAQGLQTANSPLLNTPLTSNIAVSLYVISPRVTSLRPDWCQAGSAGSRCRWNFATPGKLPLSAYWKGYLYAPGMSMCGSCDTTTISFSSFSFAPHCLCSNTVRCLLLSPCPSSNVRAISSSQSVFSLTETA